MKSKSFILNEEFNCIDVVNSPIDHYHQLTYSVPTLPAYAINNYVIRHGFDSGKTYSGGTVFSLEAPDRVVFKVPMGYLVGTLYTPPVLTISYIGIRSYALFFPHLKKQEAERAGLLLEEADKAFDAGNWLSFSLMAGGVFEFLLGRLSGNLRLPLSEMINRAKEKQIISDDDIRAIDDARKARNLIHAGKIEEPYMSRSQAMDIRLILDRLLDMNWNIYLDE